MKQVDPYYLSPQWQKLRLEVLRRDKYLCHHCGVKCLGKAKGFPSPHVDHILPRKKGGKDHIDNLRTLCGPCHSRTTANDRHHADKPTIGADGYPIDQE